MKHITLVLSAICVGLGARAQLCDLPLPPTSVVISSNGSYSMSSAAVWVCPGVTATFTGNNVAIYQETASTVTVNGNDCGLFVPNGATALVNGADISGLHGPAATITNNGDNNSFFLCSPDVTYDYSNAPAPGCAGTGIRAADPAEGPVVRYDMAARQLSVILPSGWSGIRVVDIHGREVHVGSAGSAVLVDAAAWPAGAYWVHVWGNGKSHTQGFVRP